MSLPYPGDLEQQPSDKGNDVRSKAYNRGVELMARGPKSDLEAEVL